MVGVVAAAARAYPGRLGLPKTPTTTTPVTDAFNAANGQVFNPSDKKGGTMKFAISEDWDSVDPGDTYYGLSWNLAPPVRPRADHVQGGAGRRG